MIAKQSGVCGFATWLGIATLIIGFGVRGASAEVSRMGIQPGNNQLAAEDAKDQGQDKDKKDEKKDDKKDEKKGLPLKPDHKVTFTTDEATWLSLDVSPDGKTIVFELVGDLYTLPIEGGDAKRLAVSDTSQKDGDTQAFDSQPHFSPDGKWIAFISDRDGNDNLWIAKSDGTEPKALTKDNRLS